MSFHWKLKVLTVIVQCICSNRYVVIIIHKVGLWPALPWKAFFHLFCQCPTYLQPSGLCVKLLRGILFCSICRRYVCLLSFCFWVVLFGLKISSLLLIVLFEVCVQKRVLNFRICYSSLSSIHCMWDSFFTPLYSYWSCDNFVKF
jgi:hypothetical protein